MKVQLDDSSETLSLVLSCFQNLFLRDYDTLLKARCGEPLYLPKSETGSSHVIYFVEHNWSSALHEVAHWCIAGQRRRTLTDYGYWYEPDGRDKNQQLIFEKVEAKPQALEWLFSSALRKSFFVSIDNLNGSMVCSDDFKRAILNEAKNYLTCGLPVRANAFLEALQDRCSSHDFFDSYWRKVLEKEILPY